MPYPSRRKNTTVVTQLAESPQNTSFIQTVRVIERAVALSRDENGDRQQDISNSVGRFSPPIHECIRFKNNQSLSFPNSEVVSVKAPKNSDANQWEVGTSFLGLTGSHGVMPYSFTEMLLQRLKLKDPSLSEFFDLFHHRTVSLFYQASIKYKHALSFERKHLPSRGNFTHSNDSVTEILRAITGIATKGLDAQLSIPPESLLFYSGLFSQNVRTASGLKQLLSSYFNVPIKLNEFEGRWQDVMDDYRSRLPDISNPKGQNVCLGQSTMLGKRGWVVQEKVKVIIGPLDAEQFRLFAPGGSALTAMNDLVRFYVGVDNDFDFNILVKRDATPDRVQLDKDTKPIIGWNTWLAGGHNNNAKAGDTISISLSSKKL